MEAARLNDAKIATKAGRFLLSVVTPAYNEADNILVLHERLKAVLDKLQLDWEWIIIDDHSADKTFHLASKLAMDSQNVRAFRLSRNFGSHAALQCGLDHARGACVVGLAGDLQDPPEVIPALVEKWANGAQVVWAARAQRLGESKAKLLFSRLYYFMMRRLVGLSEMPAEGADFFLLDRRVVQALRKFDERNVSLLSLVTWIGFRQEVIQYDKQARLHGTSGWDLEKKFKLAIDSLTAFSYQPVRIMSMVGLGLAVLAFIYMVIVVINGLRGYSPEGWASLMVAVLFIGGLQIMMFGMLGEYIWRSLEEARRRPSYIVEDQTEPEPSEQSEGQKS